MALIAKELVKHQKILDYSSIYETYLRKGTDKQIWLVNTNKLIRLKEGVDGLKTGYTKDSGYCLTATMKKDNMRVIAVVMGEEDSATRNDEVSGMLDYAFAQYKLDTLFTKNTVIDSIKLDKSNVDKVDIVPKEDVNLLYKKIDGKKNIDYEIKYDGIKPSMNKGDVVGKLIIKNNGIDYKMVDITIYKDIKKASYLDLLYKNFKNIIVGNI
jgi:D-alanyl-D-alanine carboxypeptidase (penicillin-binding protein 5/6)